MANNFSELIDLSLLKKFKEKIVSLLNSKADSSHKHTKSDITDFPAIPTSLKNPSSLTLSKNGTSYSYDGSAAATVGAIYTPTAAGTAGYELVSNGSGAPMWKPPNYASCTTAAGTVAKTVTVSNFKLVAGVHVTIKFTYAHTATTAATLNVNSTGAKTIYYFNGNQATKDYSWVAGEIVEFVYDGSYWRAVASNRFAKRFADIETALSAMSNETVSGELSVSVDIPKGERKTFTYDLGRKCSHGYMLYEANSTPVAFYSVLKKGEDKDLNSNLLVAGDATTSSTNSYNTASLYGSFDPDNNTISIRVSAGTKNYNFKKTLKITYEFY